MRRSAFLLSLLVLTARGAWSTTVPIYLMTKPAPTSCDQPLAYTTFSTTDPAAYLWFAADNANAGDVFATEYYTPSGGFYAPTSGSFDPLPEGGNWCFTDAPFEIAGQPPANMPGAWRVVAKLNGVQVFRLTFQIVASSTCSYAISPVSDTMDASGGSGGVLVNTDASCSWQAATNVSWMQITAGSSGTGSGSVGYAVDANTGPSRTGTLTIAGLTFTLTQPGGGGQTGAPAIAANGVVNAASNRAGKLACGGFFTIYGANLGPATPQGVVSFPLQDTMGGVVVTVTGGGATKRAWLHYVSDKQINAILPSDMPDGDAQVTVTYNGNSSAPVAVKVMDSFFGIFSTAGGSGPGIIQNYNSPKDQPVNSPLHSAKPGQIAILWGTGLGPITSGDNMPAPGGNMTVPVEVRVGGKLATTSYVGRAPSFAGVDNVYFTVPASAPQGCSVPVQIKAGSNWSNTVRMAIHSSGQHCQDAANPFGGMMQNGGKVGAVILMRAGLHGSLGAGKPTLDISVDLGLASFADIVPGGEFSYSPLLSLPPIGTCVSTERSLDLSSLLSNPSGATGLLGMGSSKGLDAGPALYLTGSAGNATLKAASTETPGIYAAIGGDLSSLGLSGLAPPFLGGTKFVVSGPGGKDVGSFTATLNMPSAVNWTNRDQLNVINRTAGATVSWTGGDSSQVVLIAGGSTNQDTKDSGGFFCLAPAEAHSFAIPVSNLADVPPTGATLDLSHSLGGLLIISLPKASQSFTATGLDSGFGFVASAFIGIVQYK